MLSNYTPQQKVQQLLPSFGTDSSRIIDKLPLSYTYEDLLQVLQSIYDPPGQHEALQMKLRTLRRTTKQTPREFADDVHDAVCRAYPHISSSERDKFVLQQFLYGQNDTIATLLNAQSGTNPHWSIEDAVNTVVRIEATADARRSDGVLSPGSILDSLHNTAIPPSIPPCMTTHKLLPNKETCNISHIEQDENIGSDELQDIVDATLFLQYRG